MVTAVLDGDSELFQAGANANEIIVPKLEMQGLAAYSRNSGYTQGDVTLTHETKQFNYERGRMFNVDAMDNEETAGVAFGKLAGEFIRTKVVPEVDAVRFAQYAGTANIGTASANISAGGWYAAVSAANAAMDDAEVPAGGVSGYSIGDVNMQLGGNNDADTISMNRYGVSQRAYEELVMTGYLYRGI